MLGFVICAFCATYHAWCSLFEVAETLLENIYTLNFLSILKICLSQPRLNVARQMRKYGRVIRDARNPGRSHVVFAGT